MKKYNNLATRYGKQVAWAQVPNQAEGVGGRQWRLDVYDNPRLFQFGKQMSDKERRKMLKYAGHNKPKNAYYPWDFRG